MAENSENTIHSLLNSLTVVPEVKWYHLADPTSAALDELAAHFGIHPLQVEDCRHRRQTARVEEHERYTFVVIKALVGAHEGNRHLGSKPTVHARGHAHHSGEALPSSPASAPSAAAPATARVRFEDFDIFLGSDYVLSVDEGECSVIPAVARRVAAEPTFHSPDRIAYALIDATVDQYLPALDHLGEFINQLEDRVIRHATPATLREIFRVKRTLLDFRRVASSMREAVNALMRRYDSQAAASRPHASELRIYYRDVYDHVVRVLDFVETYRDLLTGSLDIYLSAVANRTNEIMKILTVYGTIALPFLVFTGFYGMNIPLPFQESRFTPLLLALAMVAFALGIYAYFRRKHWF
jgi:magnesium transporter